MSLTETVIEGTLQPDGSLVLDQKPNLSPGRVTVVLRQDTVFVPPREYQFWQRMQAMWAIPKTAEGLSGAHELLAAVTAPSLVYTSMERTISPLTSVSRKSRPL
jgi:hypothetical protein